MNCPHCHKPIEAVPPEVERTCGNCKHRGENIEVMNEECDYVPSTYFQCQLGKHLNGDRPEYPPGNGFGAVDGSGYMAKICVEAEFGCKRWEPQSPPQGDSQ